MPFPVDDLLAFQRKGDIPASWPSVIGPQTISMIYQTVVAHTWDLQQDNCAAAVADEEALILPAFGYLLMQGPRSFSAASACVSLGHQPSEELP